MTTMTQEPKIQDESHKAGADKHVGKTVDATPTDKLRDECGGVRVSFNWLTTSRQVDKESKKTMAESVHSDESSFGASKRLMDPKHPTVKKANELKSQISGYWRSMSLPLASGGVGGWNRIESGVRLIRKQDIEEFDKRMRAFLSEAETVTSEMNANLEDIKRMDRARLKDLFNENDYPAEVVLNITWGYIDVSVPSYLAELAPEIYQRERDAVQEKFENTYEAATLHMLEEAQAVFGSWVDRLGPVIRVYPPEGVGDDFARFRNAEEINRETHKEDAEIPEGSVRVTLRYKESGQKGRGKSTDETLDVMTLERYLDMFKPSAMARERKTFRESTIQNLSDLLAKFNRLGDTISSSTEFQTVINKMESHLAQCRGDASAVTEELKNSATFRLNTHELAREMSQRLEREITTFKKRRQITRPA